MPECIVCGAPTNPAMPICTACTQAAAELEAEPEEPEESEDPEEPEESEELEESEVPRPPVSPPTDRELLERIASVLKKQQAEIVKIRWITGCLLWWVLLGGLAGILRLITR